MHEQRYLRQAGFVGIIPIVVMLVVFSLGRFPYPDNNRGGEEYLSYMLPHRGAELQAILSIVFNGAALLFVALLASAYRERAGRTIPAVAVMLSAMTVYTTIALIAAGLYLTIVQLARGYPSFGNSPEDLKLVTFAWALPNTVFGAGAPALGVVWAAIVVANRAVPVLPQLLAGAIAAVVATIDIVVPLASQFIDQGPWGPGSGYSTGLVLGTTFLWVLAASITLLRATVKTLSLEHAARG